MRRLTKLANIIYYSVVFSLITLLIIICTQLQSGIYVSWMEIITCITITLVAATIMSKLDGEYNRKKNRRRRLNGWRKKIEHTVNSMSTTAADQIIHSQSHAKKSINNLVEQFLIYHERHKSITAKQNLSSLHSELEIFFKKNRGVLQQIVENLENQSRLQKQILSNVNQFVEDIKNITNLAKQLEDIAWQTNILSLNATVEANRAGEAGRCFSVVASQIRDMSNRTTDIVNQILAHSDKLEDSVEAALEKALFAFDCGNSFVINYREFTQSVMDEMQSIAEELRFSINNQIHTNSQIFNLVGKSLNELEVNKDKFDYSSIVKQLDQLQIYDCEVYYE